MSHRKIIFGSRKSPLAVAQTTEAIERTCELELICPELVEMKTIHTTGDLNLAPKVSDIGGKGVFCRELEHALLAKEIDIAVHSMKDLPVIQPQGLIVDCVLSRIDPRDAIISNFDHNLYNLPRGSIVATSSLRRQAQLKKLNLELQIVSIRGNIHTRMNKVQTGDVDAVILAMAGLLRLDTAAEIFSAISPAVMLPAPAQGIICMERRVDDTEVAELFQAVNDQETSCCAVAERSFLSALGGDCSTPLGTLAKLINGEIELTGQFLSPDGTVHITKSINGFAADAEALGLELARYFLAEAASRGVQAIMGKII